MSKNHRISKYSGAISAKLKLCAIALSLTFISLNVNSLNAQDKTSGYRFLQDIETGTNVDWSFSSEDEPLSVKDDIKELEDYSLSDSDAEADMQLIEEDRRWGNRGDVEDYSIEAEFYEN